MYVAIAIVSFVFGLTVTIADSLNEHGLTLFKGSSILFGVLWGISGSILILLSKPLLTLYFALVLYWLLRLKLDRTNHAIGATLMIATTASQLSGAVFDGANFAWIIGSLVLTGYSKTYLEARGYRGYLLLLLRFRLYLIPASFSIVIHDPSPFLATLVGMVGRFVSARFAHRTERSYYREVIQRASRLVK